MQSNELMKRVSEAAAARGWRTQFLPIARRVDAWNELSVRKDRGELDATLFDTYLAGFSGLASLPDPDLRSILLVAVPAPMVRLSFRYGEADVPVTIPPTYLRLDSEDDKHVERTFAQVLKDLPHRIVAAVGPKKLLAVRSGMARYGRNNITYMDGLGSYYRLTLFYTSLAAEQDPWGEPDLIPLCASCRACLEHCPTGAITDERFLLHAERCVTFWNEKPGDVPFPAWIDPESHNQLIGCMRCQDVCPYNKDRLRVDEGLASFTASETELLLRGAAADDLSPALRDKLEKQHLLDYLEVMPRNLYAVLQHARTKGS